MAEPEPPATISVRLETLGCRLNEAETETWARGFRARGYRVVAGDEPTDLLVVNTCAVTADAVRKSRQLLARLQRRAPRARLVVSGCAVSLPTPALPTDGVDLLVPNQDKDRLVAIAGTVMAPPHPGPSGPAPGATPIPLPGPLPEPTAGATLFTRGRQRAFVKIQDGCRHQCSFCVTTIARGAERSRPIAAICDEVAALTAAGVQEVVLTGVHAAGYGSDLGGNPLAGSARGTDLAALLDALLARTAMPRIRLGSLEPWGLPADFWTRFADPRLLPHLHLPLQSGADSVLRRMARRCKRADFAALLADARAAVPDLNVSTDIIVGFPGETDAEWQQTLDAVAAFGFGQLHIFSYSPRAGTRAADLPGPVPEGVKRARSQTLEALGAGLRRAAMLRLIGRTLPVLIEGGGGGSGRFGYTPNYLPVRVSGLEALATAERAALDNGSGPPPIDRIVPIQMLAISDDGTALLGQPAQTGNAR